MNVEQRTQLRKAIKGLRESAQLCKDAGLEYDWVEIQHLANELDVLIIKSMADDLTSQIKWKENA